MFGQGFKTKSLRSLVVTSRTANLLVKSGLSRFHILPMIKLWLDLQRPVRPPSPWRKTQKYDTPLIICYFFWNRQSLHENSLNSPTNTSTEITLNGFTLTNFPPLHSPKATHDAVLKALRRMTIQIKNKENVITFLWWSVLLRNAVPWLNLSMKS